MADTSSNGTGSYAPANWIALTADATAPSTASTTLTGELTGGTMGRAQATYGHTNGTSSYTLTRNFTSDRTVTVAKMGVFTASTGGTLAFETMLDTTAALKSGDTIQVVETVTL
jgi:hypothetical protein